MAQALLLFVVLGCVYQVYPLTVQDVEKDFLNYLMTAIEKPVMKDAKEEVKYSLVPNSKGCWGKCNRKGGLCESTCGKHGYCCRKGYRDCVNELAALNPSSQHACVRPNDYKPWYCAVSVSGVKKTSKDLKTAQEALGKGSSRSRQAIIPMNGQVALDPHALAKGWGKGSMWWYGWGDIDNMRGKCEKAVMPKPEEVKYSLVPNSKGCWGKCNRKGGLCESICGKHGYCCRKGYRDCVNELAALNPSTQHACVRPNDYKPWYCAVSVSGVKKTSTELTTAQEALGKGSSGNRQAIIPMNGQVALDPHALAKDWGKGSMWWWGWGDIDNMRGKCEKAEMPKAAPVVVVAPVKPAPTPVDGGFSSWGDYGTCSRKCGQGDQTRRRQCNNPAPKFGGKACAGASSETRKCDIQSCKGRKTGFYWKELSACDYSKDIIKDSATCKMIQNSGHFGTGPFGSVAESYSLPLGCSFDGSKWHFNNLKNKAVCSETYKCICLRQ